MSVAAQLRLASGIRTFGVLLVCIVLALVATDLWHTRVDLLAGAEQTNENLVHVLAEQTARTMQAVDLTLTGVGDVLRDSGLRGRDPGEVDHLLALAVATSPYIRALFVTDERGWLVHRSDPTPPIDVSDRPYFRHHRDGGEPGLYIAPPLISRVDGRWAIIASRRLTTHDGRFEGVVGATVEPRYFADFYAALKIGPHGSVAMFLRDGTLLARSPHTEALVGTSFADRPPFRDLLARHPEGNARTSAFDGRPLLLSYRSVPGFPLVVVVSTSEEQPLAEWRRDVVAAGIGALVLVAIIAGLTFALQRQVRTLAESEARFRSVFEHSLDAMALMAPDGQLLEANPIAQEWYGPRRRGQLASIGALADPADARAGAAVEELAGTGRFQGELRLIGANARVITAEVSASTFRDADGNPRIACTARDVTEQRALEQRARLQATALEAAANGIVISDRDGTIVWVNPAITALTGYTAAELLGQSMEIFRSDEETPDQVEQRWRTIRAGGVWQAQLERGRRDGSRFIEDQTITPVADAGGEITHFVAIKQDVTERIRAQEELQRQRDLALQREKLAEMGQLLAGVAHELNNPLSVVLGHTGLLRNYPDPAIGQRARNIARAAERCSRIVRNFLALARQYPPEMKPVSLNAIAAETLELLGYQLRVESIDVEAVLDPELPVLSGDAHQLQQVVVNLVTNAWQALRTTPQPRRLSLVTTHDRAAERVVLEVSDSGPGIPPDLLEQIFQPFFTTKPVGEGTGLGLPICLGIVEGHGGTLSVRSAPGEGATFRVEIPLRPASSADAASNLAPADPRPVRVLVVDDEPDVVAVLRDMLSARGHRVDTATDGAAALGRLRSQDVDVILCDIKMPGMGGIEFHDLLHRERPDLARRVVFVTGDTFALTTSAFLAGVGQPSIAKPFSEDTILQALAAVLTEG